MRHAAVYDEEDLADNSADLSLGMGTLIGIFFGLALVCGVFFGFGYMMGHRTPGPLRLVRTALCRAKGRRNSIGTETFRSGTRTAFRRCACRVAHHKPSKRIHSAGKATPQSAAPHTAVAASVEAPKPTVVQKVATAPPPRRRQLLLSPPLRQPAPSWSKSPP